MPVIIGAVVGAYMGGSVANNNFNLFQWDYRSDRTWSGIGIGAVTGALSGAGWSVGLAAVGKSGFWAIAGKAILAGKIVNVATTGASMISNFENGARIMAGRYYTGDGQDERGEEDEQGEAPNFWNQLGRGVSRYTWEGLQTWLGYNHSQIRNTMGLVSRVEYFGGATFSINENDQRRNWWFSGVSLGNNISINLRNGFNQENNNRGWMYSADGLYWHEYGHTFDSRIYGFGYIPFIGIPSAREREWTETRANNHAWNYARRRGFMQNWLYPVEFPLQ